MKRHTQLLSRVIFWLAWPVWFIYFQSSNRRSRVLVVSGGELLLIRDWLGGGDWGLPGGGAKKNEPIEASAVRELAEEAGLRVASSSLKPLGDYQHSKSGLKFRAYFFLLELPEKPVLRRQRREVAEVRWLRADELVGLNLNDDTTYALQAYRPKLTI